MRRINLAAVTLCVLVSAGALVPGTGAAATSTGVEQREALQRVEAQRRADEKRCDTLSGNDKTTCKAQAKAAEKSAKARVDAAYRGTEAERNAKIEAAKADPLAASAHCNAMSGDAKSACVKRAKAHDEQAVAAARQDAGQRKLDADYDAEIARCGKLAAAAKTSCVDAANARFGRRF